jgi:hypothetical protein
MRAVEATAMLTLPLTAGMMKPAVVVFMPAAALALYKMHVGGGDNQLPFGSLTGFFPTIFATSMFVAPGYSDVILNGMRCVARIL